MELLKGKIANIIPARQNLLWLLALPDCAKNQEPVQFYSCCYCPALHDVYASPFIFLYECIACYNMLNFYN